MWWRLDHRPPVRYLYVINLLSPMFLGEAIMSPPLWTQKVLWLINSSSKAWQWLILFYSQKIPLTRGDKIYTSMIKCNWLENYWHKIEIMELKVKIEILYNFIPHEQRKNQNGVRIELNTRPTLYLVRVYENQQDLLH